MSGVCLMSIPALRSTVVEFLGVGIDLGMDRLEKTL